MLTTADHREMLPNDRLNCSHSHTSLRRLPRLSKDPLQGYRRSRAPGPYETQWRARGPNRLHMR